MSKRDVAKTLLLSLTAVMIFEALFPTAFANVQPIAKQA
jgi:hypothetical protein